MHGAEVLVGMRRGNKDRLTNRIVQMAGAVRLPTVEGREEQKTESEVLDPTSQPFIYYMGTVHRPSVQGRSWDLSQVRE